MIFCCASWFKEVMTHSDNVEIIFCNSYRKCKVCEKFVFEENLNVIPSEALFSKAPLTAPLIANEALY